MAEKERRSLETRKRVRPAGEENKELPSRWLRPTSTFHAKESPLSGRFQSGVLLGREPGRRTPGTVCGTDRAHVDGLRTGRRPPGIQEPLESDPESGA